MTHSIVIGGTRGIGRAVVRTFAAEGHHVTAMGRSSPPDADRDQDGVTYQPIDVCDQAASAVVFESLPKVDNVVFLQRYRGATDAWDGEHETTLSATRRIIELLVARRDPPRSFVLMSSVASSCVAHNQPASYHVAKAGVDQLVRYFAVALGARGIRVNGVAPATTLKEESQDVFLGNAALLALYAQMIPLGRMGTSQDIADVVSFLCSDRASFVTGQILVVDGGMTLQCPESLVRQTVGF
ncbi:MAG: SDR family oxidoreductase [Planctomycetia bacterium]|nr:SDR family oxidoreductase [Planctomycetia bacterium]